MVKIFVKIVVIFLYEGTREGTRTTILECAKAKRENKIEPK